MPPHHSEPIAPAAGQLSAEKAIADQTSTDHAALLQLSRREFLGAAVATGLAVGAATTPAHARRQSPDKPLARNLIFCVVDGMSAGTLTLADLTMRERHQRSSRWIDFLSRRGVRTAVLNTSSANSIVTDSAAASTSWGIGLPVNNGAIGYTPDERLMSPIFHRAKQAGYTTALVTTTRLTHATPAGFVASIPTGRDDEASIAEQLLERRVDLMLGGGAAYLTPERIALHADLRTVRTRRELLELEGTPRAAGSRLLGVFAPQHLAFEIDRPADQPSLSEMTRFALASLADAPNGFAIQIEGGRVDHAAHNNDAGALVRDQIAFDEAIAYAIDFAEGRDDTLLILTADHANGNPGLAEYGVRGNQGFARLASASHSFDWIFERVRAAGRDASPADLASIVEEATAVRLTEEESLILQRSFRGERIDPYLARNSGAMALASLLANHTGVPFVNGNHTADYVPFIARGPGAQHLPHFMTQSDVHTLMTRALGLPPSEPL